MSKNIIRTIGHHTCGKCNNDELLANAPFKSEEGSFLGIGYYFWDNNIETAKWWGENNYGGNYSIVEIDLELKGDSFLDLVGSREDITIFSKLYDEICKRDGGNDLGIAEVIRRLNLIHLSSGNSSNKYSVIRALDISSVNKRAKFNPQMKGSVNLDPKIIICFFDKTDLQLDQLNEIY